MARRISLKSHWIDALTQIADAGRDGVRAAEIAARSAAALEHRDLVISFEKIRYAGLDNAPDKTRWYRLTDAGLAWLVEHRTSPTPSWAVPAGWVKTDGGGYLHAASRIKVRRESRRWEVLRPLGPVNLTVPMYVADDIKSTRAEAFAAAERMIPGAVAFVQAATFEQTGRPESWPAEQADEPTVVARHLAVHASGSRTGYQAKPGERVIHLELGHRGTYVAGDGDCSYVQFDGEFQDNLVHSNDVIVITEPHTVRAMQVTRSPKYADYTQLGGPNEPGEDYYLLVDGEQIGGTYWCSAADIPDGQRWASWGVAGYSLRHPDREAAEQVQVREYAANPDLFDRLHEDARREDREERERREAEQLAEQARYDEARRLEREGDDGPGLTVWELPSHHYLIADPADVATVKAWLDVHDLDDVSGVHPIRVELRATRRVIVVERARFAPFSLRTQTWAVTCVQDPPDVDCTPRPDLVELAATHYPVKFPLIDFGQSWACSACTKELGSASEIVPWECPTFAKAREEGAAELAVAAAGREVAAADQARHDAIAANRDDTPERNRVDAAQLNLVRRRLALDAIRRDPARHAEVRFALVSCSDDDGNTWRPFHWLGFVPLPSETASAQALRYAVTRCLTETPHPRDDVWGLREDPKPWRVEIFINPMAAEPDGVWTNLAAPCRAGQHDAGPHPIGGEAPRPAGSSVQHAVCARCFHRVWRITVAGCAAGRWVLEGEPLPGIAHPDSDPDPDSDLNMKIDFACAGGPSPASSPGPSPGGAPVSFGFRIDTRTDGRWRTVRVGGTPAVFSPDPEVLLATADTILGNARQALGLGPGEPLPGVRVRAWHRQSGRTVLVSRRADRRRNRHA